MSGARVPPPQWQHVAESTVPRPRGLPSLCMSHCSRQAPWISTAGAPAANNSRVREVQFGSASHVIPWGGGELSGGRGVVSSYKVGCMRFFASV